jgi:hypothetical protein
MVSVEGSVRKLHRMPFVKRRPATFRHGNVKVERNRGMRLALMQLEGFTVWRWSRLKRVMFVL